MATLWHCLSKENQRKLARFYEQQFGRKLTPPSRDKRAIHLEAKLESLEEIDRLMRKPGRGAWHG